MFKKNTYLVTFKKQRVLNNPIWKFYKKIANKKNITASLEDTLYDVSCSLNYTKARKLLISLLYNIRKQNLVSNFKKRKFTY